MGLQNHIKKLLLRVETEQDADKEAAASAIEIRNKFHTGSQKGCRDSCVPIAAAAERLPPSKLDAPLSDWGCNGAY